MAKKARYAKSSLKLLEPLQVGSIGTLSNRVVLSAMTRARTDNASHTPNDIMREYYAQRKSAGMILTEGTHISPQAIGWVDAPGIWTEAQAEGWKRVIEEVSGESSTTARMVCQLWHQGRQSDPSLVETKEGKVVAPSAVAAAGQVHTRKGKHDYPVPTALTLEEIPAVIADFAHAAELAIHHAGFHGVEIHAANGYVIDQFLQTKSNLRTDQYGAASLENRTRFLREVIGAVIAKVPASKVGVKLSPNGVFGDMGSPDYLELFDKCVEICAEHDLAFIELMDGLTFGFHELGEPYTSARARKILDRVQAGKKKTVLIANCGYTRETAEAGIVKGDFDAVSFGRPYISNPDLPERFADEVPLTEDEDRSGWFAFGVGAKGYTTYERATKE